MFQNLYVFQLFLQRFEVVGSFWNDLHSRRTNRQNCFGELEVKSCRSNRQQLHHRERLAKLTSPMHVNFYDFKHWSCTTCDNKTVYVSTKKLLEISCFVCVTTLRNGRLLKPIFRVCFLSVGPIRSLPNAKIIKILIFIKLSRLNRKKSFYILLQPVLNEFLNNAHHFLLKNMVFLVRKVVMFFLAWQCSNLSAVS